MQIVLSHCWTGNPDFLWYPRTRKALEERGFQVAIPALPNPDTPQLSEWLTTFAEAVPPRDDSVILVGHSLGCANLLHYLEGLDLEQKVKGVVLVAGFTDDLGIPELRPFFTTQFDWAKIKQHADFFTCLHSDNDPYVQGDPFQYAFTFLRELRAKLVIVPDGGHFSSNIGDAVLPEVITCIEEIAQH